MWSTMSVGKGILRGSSLSPSLSASPKAAVPGSSAAAAGSGPRPPRAAVRWISEHSLDEVFVQVTGVHEILTFDAGEIDHRTIHC